MVQVTSRAKVVDAENDRLRDAHFREVWAGPAADTSIEAELPGIEALNEPDDAAGEVEDLNCFLPGYALAA